MNTPAISSAANGLGVDVSSTEVAASSILERLMPFRTKIWKAPDDQGCSL